MRSRTILRQTAREWFCGLMCLSLVLAPMAGCPNNAGDGGGGEGDGVDNKTATGLYINSDNNAEAIVGARGQDGAVFFVYGTRGPNGGLGQIDSIAVTTADSKNAFVAFESGRPVHAEGPDGSYVHISYSNVTALSLDASIALFDASTGGTTNYQTSIDLRQTAADVATLVQERTGLAITPVSVVDGGTIQTGKTLDRASVRITILPLYAIVVLPLAAAVYAMTVILGQVLYAVFAVVAQVVQVLLLIILSPIFLIAQIFSGAVIRVRPATLDEIFDSVPYPPTVLF
jgi:hypothetical protein